MMTTLSGIAASPGIGIGPVHVLDPEEIEVKDGLIPTEEVQAEQGRFKAAIEASRQEVAELRRKIALETGEEHARLLDPQLAILEDPEATSQALAAIERDRRSAGYIYRKILGAVAAHLEESDGEYYRDRALDIRDVRRRVLGHLGGIRSHTLSDLRVPSLVVAYDIAPSEMALASRDKILGFAIDLGGRTSHTAIMARARGIPTVVGLKQAMDAAREGATALVDGTRGVAIFDPEPEVLEEHRLKQRRYRELAANLAAIKDQECRTQDGVDVHLGANLEVPEELPSVIENGAEAIGLYRTEFFYLSRSTLPTEDAQYQAYRTIVEAMAPKPVTIRTLDVGGDKFASYLGTPVERNPFLGMRGLRFSLQREDIFRTQLRAILRATVHGQVRVMFPMVIGLEDFRRARQIVEEVRADLEREEVPMASHVPLGVMVETPASVFAIDLLAREADFASIGTNDLIQYTLAIDRTDDTVSHLYDPLHPAVLNLIAYIIKTCNKAGKPIALCGEMAGDVRLTRLLLGFGLRQLSMHPASLLEVKQQVLRSNLREIAPHTAKMLRADDSNKLRAMLARLNI